MTPSVVIQEVRSQRCLLGVTQSVSRVCYIRSLTIPTDLWYNLPVPPVSLSCVRWSSSLIHKWFPGSPVTVCEVVVGELSDGALNQ